MHFFEALAPTFSRRVPLILRRARSTDSDDPDPRLQFQAADVLEGPLSVRGMRHAIAWGLQLGMQLRKKQLGPHDRSEEGEFRFACRMLMEASRCAP